MRQSGRYVVMGVCSTGKSHIGSELAARLGGVFVDGDDLHPPGNVEKMASGTPLNDEDRAPWLDTVGQTLSDRTPPIVVACSSLKRAYRDRIRRAAPEVVFLHLTGDRAVIETRMRGRKGHFMPLSLLDSQLDTLEPLAPDETGTDISIADPPQVVVEKIAGWLARSGE